MRSEIFWMTEFSPRNPDRSFRDGHGFALTHNEECEKGINSKAVGKNTRPIENEICTNVLAELPT